MLSRIALFLALATLSLTARPADACSPAPGCGDRICSNANGFVDATILELSSDGLQMTVMTHAAFGDAPGFAIGTQTMIGAYPSVVSAADVGQRRYVYVEHIDTDPVVNAVKDPADPDFAECLGADATTADIAAQILQVDCNIQLIDHRPPSSCPADTCNAGGRGSVLTVVALTVFVVVPRRRRGRKAPRGATS
jgi:hypothetical protein